MSCLGFRKENIPSLQECPLEKSEKLKLYISLWKIKNVRERLSWRTSSDQAAILGKVGGAFDSRVGLTSLEDLGQ